MKITSTELEPHLLSITCEANAAEIADKKQEILQAFKKAPVKGFRKDKQPSMDAIQLQYAKEIHESLKRAMAEHCYHEAIFTEKLRVIGPPTFKSMLLQGNVFTCDFETHTKPDFILPNWKTYEIPRPHQVHTAEDVVQKMLNEVRTKLGDQIPYGDNDFLQLSDNVVVSYSASVDGKSIDSLSAKDEVMVIGQSPLAEFDQQLLGMNVGETREFDVIGPEGGLPSLSGKTIHFTVSLSTGSKNIPANLDDELAKKMGKKDFNELQEMIGQAAFARVEAHNRLQLNEAIGKKLVAETEIEVPQWMSISEAQYLAQQSKVDWNALADADREKFIELAINHVKLSLILDKCREDTPECQLTDQEVFEIIKQNLSQTQQPGANLDEIMQEANRTGYLQVLMNRIKDEATMNEIVKHVKLID